MAGRLTISTLNNDTGVLATQNGMTGIAKAWLMYNGSTSTILNSFNVASVTKVGTGQYTVNFTTAMPSANYGIVVGGSTASNGSTVVFAGIAPYGSPTAPTTTSCTIGLMGSGGNTATADVPYVSVAIFSA